LGGVDLAGIEGLGPSSPSLVSLAETADKMDDRFLLWSFSFKLERNFAFAFFFAETGSNAG
jgi:hypothetical protein